MNFLDQFTQGNVSKPAASPKPKDTKIQPVVIPKKMSDKYVENEEVERKISAPVHVTEVDQGYHKRKIIKMGILGTSTLVIAAATIFIFLMSNTIEVPDFIGTDQSQLTTWGIQNNITPQIQEEYDLEFDAGQITYQGIAPGESIRRGSVMEITVSLGADPNEVVELPDFEEMTLADARAWNQDYRMNFQIRTVYDDEIEEGGFIRLEFANTNTDPARFQRREGGTVLFSSGIESLIMPNFVGSSREDVKSWAEENDLSIDFIFVSSKTVDAGDVISQNIEPRERFTREDELSMMISAGPGIEIPNFNQMPREDAMTWAAERGLNLIIRDRLHPSIAFGRVIEQSEAAGTELIANENGTFDSITITYSLGRPFIENLIGQSASAIEQLFFNSFIELGANITFTIRQVDSYEPQGQIVGQSQSGVWLGMTDHVTIDVSRGNLQPSSEMTPSQPESQPQPTPTPESEPEPETENYPYSADN